MAEAAPSMAGHVMAASLAEAEIPTTVINDSAIFAMMVRVNKVILPCHAVMANGGLIANAGTHAVCAAANLRSTSCVRDWTLQAIAAVPIRPRHIQRPAIPKRYTFI